VAVGTTRSKRRLGRYLRPFLDASGKKIEQVAQEVRCSRQTVSRLFSGEHLPRFHLFTALLAVLGVTGAERERALELWELADATSVNIEYLGALAPNYARFRKDESEAELERVIDTVLVSGLLQTPEYVKAVALSSPILWKGAWDEEMGAAERRDRQALLSREDRPLRLHALLDEATILRMVGGPSVMAGQLDRLLEIGARPNVTIQVIPLAAGAYGAMSGPLCLLTFREEDEPDAGYVESLAGMSVVDSEQDVATLTAMWDAATRAALSTEKSAEVIRKVRTAL
jgi:transcriptional regulator with XRE-family HTH domain